MRSGDRVQENSEKSILDTTFYILLAIFTILLFISTKYGLRLASYVIIPMGIYKAYKNKKYEKTGFEYYILFFFLAMSLSSIGAYSFKSIKDEVLDTGTMLLVFLSMVQFPIKRQFLDYIYSGALIGFIYKLSLSYLERFGYIKGKYGRMRISGWEDVWRYAPVITFAAVILLCLLFFKKNTKREYIGFTLALFVVLDVLIKTQNRGNWVALICCFILMLILKLKRKAIFPILLFGLLIVGISQKYDNNKYVKRMNSIVKKRENGRIELWQTSVDIFKKHPIKGIGYSYKNFANAEVPEEYRYLPKHPHGHSHNSSLYILATMGVLGILSYLALTFKMLWFSFENRKFDYGIAFFMILSIQIFSLFETPVKYKDLTGMLMLALGILYNQKNRKTKF